MKNNWPKNVFGDSECRETVKQKTTDSIVKGVPLPQFMDNTGNEDSQIQEELCKTYPQGTVTRPKRGVNTPKKVLEISCATEHQANQALKTGIYLRKFWIQSEKNRVLRV